MIKILVKTDTRYPVNRKIIRRAIIDKVSESKISSDVELSVSVVGERAMRALCRKYMDDNNLHDVLSFPFMDLSKKGEGFVSYPDRVLRLGDVIICWPQLLISAAKDDKLVDDEVYFLTGHAVEHLLGKHHE